MNEDGANEKEVESPRTYLLVFERGGKKRITVPANWKVTFGPAAVGLGKTAYGGAKVPMAIRFYEDENRQRAIFTEVVSFRDMSIPVLEERRTTQTKTGHMDLDGARKNVNVQAEVREWVDPDNDEDDNHQLISGFGDDITLD